MPFPVLGSNSAVAGGYEINNSLRFNEGDDAKLSFDPASAGNVDTMTLSFWMKPDLNFGGDHNNIFSVRPSAGSYAMLVHRTGGEILFEHSGAGDILKTNRLFRDPSAWYHIVLALDSTNSTAALRARLYVNGIEETSFATDNRASHSQNTDFLFGGTNPHQISGDPTGGSFYGGYLSEMYYVNGSQLAPTEFGEFNENGVWVPIRYSGSYGTNGFKLEFQDSGNLGDDTSGNGNDFTATNLAAFDITTDTPTNNFCTMNPLATGSRSDFREGNSQVKTNVQGSVPYGQVEFGTFFVNKGKWYYEAKISSVGSGGKMGLGWNERYESGNYTNSHNNIGSNGNALYSHQGDIKIGSGSDFSTGVDSYTTNDIIGCAIDLDNNKVYWHKNGNYQDDPTPNPASNDGRSLGTATYNNTWTPWVTKDDTINNCNVKFNFGNPPYTNSSSQSDDNGYGDFEYDVPTGFYSLCTKNLAEFG